METNFDYDTPIEVEGKSSIQSLPLPPPPTLDESTPEVELPTLRIRDKELQQTHHLKDDLGREGKYRRTSSPTICSAPNVRPSVNSSSSASASQQLSQKNQSDQVTSKDTQERLTCHHCSQRCSRMGKILGRQNLDYAVYL